MVGKFIQNGCSGEGKATEETVSLVQEYPIFSLTDKDNQKAFNEKVAFAISELMPRPTYVRPVVQLSDFQSIAEIGSAVTLQLNATFVKNDAGAIQTLEIRKNGAVLASNAQNSLAKADTFTMPNATIPYFSKAIFAAGDIKKNALGIAVEAGKIQAGEVVSPTKNIKGVYPVFFGTILPNQTINEVNIATLTKIVTESSGNIPLNFSNVVGKKLVVLVPSISPRKTKWFVTESNKGTIGNTGDLFAAPTAKSFNSPNNFWQNIDYQVYISNVTNINTILQLQN